VVLAGASNLKHSADFFIDPTFSYVDISTPGWTPTPDYISTNADQMKQTVIGGAKAFVFYLFGNIAVRYEPLTLPPPSFMLNKISLVWSTTHAEMAVDELLQ
jgi:hypothetical protein